MKKVIITATLMAILVVQYSHAQDKSVFKAISVSASMQTYESQQEPAQFQFTLPHEGSSSWLLNAAASVGLKPLSKGTLTSKFVAEFHRNTLIDDEQYNYQAGYQFEIMDGDGSKLTPYITGNVKYVRDQIADKHSLAASVNALPYYHPDKGFVLGSPGYFNSENFTYVVAPSIEFQYQEYFASATHSGSILRPIVNLSNSLAFNKEAKYAPLKLLELTFNYVWRYALINSTANEEGRTSLLKTGLNYYLYSGATGKSSPVSLGINYNQGSDPLNGLLKQRYWLFSLQVKI